MTWWTLANLVNSRHASHLNVHCHTNTADHLFMSWHTFKPARSAIIKLIRGVLKHCGYEYIWDTPHVEEQQQSGDTIAHSFRIDRIHASQHLWYYLHAPGGPYGRQIQGPLTHIQPFDTDPWPTECYLGTKEKGVYYTPNFSGPGDPQPYWTTRNLGLHSLVTWQLCPDPWDPGGRQFAIAGAAGDRTVYRRQPWDSEAWTPVLTNAQALALTGATSGEICWIAANSNLYNEFYVLFNSAILDAGTWCLHTFTGGNTWNPFQISAGLFNRSAGNISVGLEQGASPYPPGYVLYATINTGIVNSHHIFLSVNRGLSWTLKDSLGTSLTTQKCQVDPTDQSTVYMGVLISVPDFDELHRSTLHGANMTQVDQLHHLGIRIDPQSRPMWVHHTDPTQARVLTEHHIWQTSNFATSWTDHGHTQYPVELMHIFSAYPNNLFLARDTSVPPPPSILPRHVLFISTDEGATMEGKCGNNPGLLDGGGDSIPYNCGGVAHEGIMFIQPI